jgi:hypothetical protein
MYPSTPGILQVKRILPCGVSQKANRILFLTQAIIILIIIYGLQGYIILLFCTDVANASLRYFKLSFAVANPVSVPISDHPIFRI